MSASALFQRRAPLVALAVGLTLAVAALTSQAESATSSASSAASQSVGSVSSSVESSSASSGGKAQPKGQSLTGVYQVEGVQPAADRPGHVRVALARAGQDGQEAQRFQLVMPQAVQDRTSLALGQAVQVDGREYGYQFSRAGQAQAQPFFLALNDEWLQKVKMQPVAALAPQEGR